MKKLILTVDDLMSKEKAIPKVLIGTSLMFAIEVMSEKGLGVVSIIDESGILIGIITDGDLRRILEKKVDIYSVIVDNVMTKNPYNVSNKILAIDALLLIKNKNINSLPVIDKDNKLIGTLTLQQIVKAGIVI